MVLVYNKILRYLFVCNSAFAQSISYRTSVRRKKSLIVIMKAGTKCLKIKNPAFG